MQDFISLRISKEMLAMLDGLVEAGRYGNRSLAIRGLIEAGFLALELPESKVKEIAASLSEVEALLRPLAGLRDSLMARLFDNGSA